MTVVSRILGTLARLPTPTTGDVSVERDLPAKMSDGIVLLADRWFPTGGPGAHAPVILLRTPYGRRQWAGVIGRLFAERGYQAVVQSCRGTFGSGGDWVPFRHEQGDGHDTLAWIAGQPWFTGRLATFGPSYLGLTQWAVAEDAPDYLRAMALDVTSSNFRQAVVYPSECFALGTSLTWVRLLEFQEQPWWRSLWTQRAGDKVLDQAYGTLPVGEADVAAVGRHVPFFGQWLEHEHPGDRWWEPVDFGRRMAKVPPSSLVGGWYDIFLPAQLDDYRALRDAGRTVRLTIGPWTHSSPGTIATSLRDGLEWFDGYLGDGNGHVPSSRVRLFVMGERRWMECAQWPPPSVEELWYLGRGGGLHMSAPEEAPPDRYRYDPADPTPAVGGPSLNWKDAGPKEQAVRESRSDVLTYTSDVLMEKVTVIGPLSVDLHVRSTSDDCDFFVRLCDVSPRGRSRNVSDGIVRLRPDAPVREADGSAAVRIDMWATATTFARGHRIRLQVSSGAHPLFMRNAGTGEPIKKATRLVAADQEVFHDPAHPSCIRVPVIRD